MVRYSLGWILMTTVLLPVTTRADDTTPLAPAVAQCINDNAAKVEAVVDDLGKAVDFLVSNVCAEPLAAEESRGAKAASDAQAIQWQKICDEAKRQGTPAKDEKDISSFYCSSAKIGFLSEPNEGYTIFAPSLGNAPPAAIALASKRLLDLRLAHNKAGGK